MSSNIKFIILCGGSGARLWPFLRERFPKHFVLLIEAKSLLRLTLDRVKSFGFPVCFTNEEFNILIKINSNYPLFILLTHFSFRFHWKDTTYIN
jgi:mannose-1-phosphate guanylyltransferase